MAVISYLTRIEFDAGAVSRLPALLGEIGVSRPLIVTDRGLVETGMVERIAATLPGASTLFSDTPANPTEAAALAALACYQGGNCDGVVGLGGGSSIDLAKAVRLLSGHPPPLSSYVAVEGGAARIHNRICPMIAVPTTAT